MKINILPNDQEATEKEKQIIHTAIINMLSLLNALITQQGMVWNPLKEIDERNLGFEVFLAHEATEEQETEFIRRVTNQMTAFLQMSEVSYSVTIEK